MKQTQDLRTKLRARCDVLVVTIGQQRARESEKEKNKEKRERAGDREIGRYIDRYKEIEIER